MYINLLQIPYCKIVSSLMKYVWDIFSVQPPPFVEWVESIGVEVGSMTLNPLTTNAKTSCGQMENVPLDALISVHTFNCPSDAMGNGVLVTMTTVQKYPLVVCEVTVHLTSKGKCPHLLLLSFIARKRQIPYTTSEGPAGQLISSQR